MNNRKIKNFRLLSILFFIIITQFITLTVSYSDTINLDTGPSASCNGSISWNSASLIEADNGDALWPEVAIDPVGNGVAVWGQFNGSSWGVYANRYVVGTGWGMAQLIASGDVGWPEVAVDSGGNAIAVWGNSAGNIMSNRYVVGTGWGTAQLINGDGIGGGVRLAVDSSGNAIAVWAQYYGSIWGIYANRYVVGTGWGTAQLIGSDPSGAGGFSVAIDPNGNAIATWGSSSGVWANRFVVGVGWGTAQIIGTFSGGYVEWSVQVGVDQNGNAIAHWSHNAGGGVSTAWTNRYVVGTGWGTAETMPGYGQLAVDPSGNAFIVWTQPGQNGYELWVVRYIAGIGWESSQLIENENYVHATSIGVDGGGNAIVVYAMLNPNRLLAKRYIVGTGWGSADLVSTDNANYYKGGTQVSVNNAGNAIVVWFQYAGTDPFTMQSNIWANQFECSTCTAGQPTGNDDNCNGIDENCNGTADENYAPPQITCGVGACASTGQVICVNGSTQDTCTPGAPTTEICDNIDNNCDGSVDENYVFGGFQQPINSDNSSIFKAGSTIPVKIILRDCSGQSISTATVTIGVYKIANTILGTEEEQLPVGSSGSANTGNLFRYDATAGQYIYNLSTKSYTKGTYRVYANPDNGNSYSVNFSLK